MVASSLPAWILPLVLVCAPARPTQAKFENKPLEDFPHADRIWLCHVKGSLAATQEVPITATGSGRLRMLVQDGESLEKNEVFAVFRPEHLEIERKSLALERAKLQSALVEGRLEQHDKQLALAGQKSEAEAELQELNAALTLPNIGRNRDFKRKIEDSITAVQQKISRLEKRISLLEQEIADDTATTKLKLEFQRLEQNFEVMERTAEQRAPFAGSFAFTAKLGQENKGKPTPFELWTNSAELIGHITDDSSYNFTLIDYPPVLNRAPLDKLLLEIQADPSDPPIMASFLETRNEGRMGIGGSQEKVLIFRIQDSCRNNAQPLAGTTNFGQIFQQLPDACHIVTKSHLITALENRQKPTKGGWEAMARAVWPEATLVAIGNRELAFKRHGTPAKSDRRKGP